MDVCELVEGGGGEALSKVDEGKSKAGSVFMCKRRCHCPPNRHRWVREEEGHQRGSAVEGEGTYLRRERERTIETMFV